MILRGNSLLQPYHRWRRAAAVAQREEALARAEAERGSGTAQDCTVQPLGRYAEDAANRARLTITRHCCG